VKLAAVASRRLGLTTHASFSGALAWPYVYPWPQRPAGLVEDAFDELARRWKPILDVFDENGVDIGFELHPGEDLHDGVTFEMFLDRVGNHPRANILYDPSHFVLQHLDYLAFIDIYHERIKCFHVKDAELRPNGRSGVYGGYQSWVDRPGRFRSLGDGQVDFTQIFSKMAQYDYAGWAVLEWECALKHPEDGAAEGAPFIAQHIIRTTPHAFDDFAKSGADRALNQKLMDFSHDPWNRREFLSAAGLLAAALGTTPGRLLAALPAGEAPTAQQSAMLKEVSQLVIPVPPPPQAGEVGTGAFLAWHWHMG
jgi:sugar phosphate isomerase/epimerase